MTDTIAHKRAVVDAYDEGLQQGTELALQAMEMAKELEAENERLRHDLDVARAEVLRLTNPARPLAVGDRVRTSYGATGTVHGVRPEGEVLVHFDFERSPNVHSILYPGTSLERLP